MTPSIFLIILLWRADRFLATFHKTFFYLSPSNFFLIARLLQLFFDTDARLQAVSNQLNSTDITQLL